MKRWNYVAAKTGVLCAAGLFLFTTSIKALTFGRQLLTFDPLTSNSAVPDGYGGINWINFYALDASGTNNAINPSGYEADIISPNNVLFNNNGSPAAIYSGRFAFILNSAYMAGAWNDNLKVEVDGYFGKRLMYRRMYTLSTTRPIRVNFPPIFVTEVDFLSSGGTPHGGYPGSGEEFSADNMLISVLPFPVRPTPLHLPIAQ